VVTLYFPLAQISASITADWASFPMTLVVRSSSQPAGLVSAVAGAVHQVDPEIPIVDVLTMEDLISNSLSQQHMTMLLLAAFAGLALVLASVGIYSVLSYAVRRRLREIGIRMALGAQARDVLRMILGYGAKLAAIGVGICALSAFGLTLLMTRQLFGITGTVPVTFPTVGLLLVLSPLAGYYLRPQRSTACHPL